MTEHDAAGHRRAPPAPGSVIAFGRRLTVERERTITAPMDAVWNVLRDYRARQRLLGAEFADYVVRAGGVGEGTVIAYRLRIARHERAYELAVEEPTPGQRRRAANGPGHTLRVAHKVRPRESWAERWAESQPEPKGRAQRSREAGRP